MVELADYFILAGTYRILIRNTLWKQWQVIIIKLELLVAMIAIIFVVLVVVRSENFPEQLKEFIFVFVFGNFSLYYEIYNKITEIDGTNELNFHYTNIPLA